MNKLVERLKKDFQDPDYRHAYCDEFLNSFLATQIKALREQRGLTQGALAKIAHLHQSSISEMEDVSHSSWTLNTLRKLAEAFDLTLNVSFEEFGKRIGDIGCFERERLERSSFGEDDLFNPTIAATLYQQGFLAANSYHGGADTLIPNILGSQPLLVKGQ